MVEMTINDIKQAMKDEFRVMTTEIIAACEKNNQLFQAKCKANQIFCEPENVKGLFASQEDIRHHLETHKEKEVASEKRQGLLVKLLTSSVIAQAILNFFQWKNNH